MTTQKSPKKNKRTWYLLYVVTAILIVAISYFNLSSDLEKQELEIKNLENKIEKLAAVLPQKSTELLAKEKENQLLLLTEESDSLLFYKTKGKHPIYNKDLSVITEAAITLNNKKNQIIEEKPTVKKTTIIGQSKVIKKKKKPVVKKKIVRETIWNTDLINDKNRDEVSLFVFDETDKIDSFLTKRFKVEFEKRSYFITKEIIFADVMTIEIAANLQEKNINYFKGNLAKYTDYVCIAKATYSYTQNLYRDDFIDCTMSIDYYIYSSETGKVLLSEKDKVIGSDQNKEKSKQRAIEKFVM